MLLLERGAFDGAHAAMMVHPWHEDRLEATCLAVDHFDVRYTGREAHASAAPDKGVNAADALVVAQVAIGLLRQHLRPGDQVHGIVTKGGDAANIVPKDGDGPLHGARPVSGPAGRAAARGSSGASRRARLATGATLAIEELSPTYSEYVGDAGPRRAAGGQRRGARAALSACDDAGTALPTISTDMANVSLAVPSIHP